MIRTNRKIIFTINIAFKRSMNKLVDIPKTQTFTQYIDPDSTISTHKDAFDNVDDIIHKPRILKSGGFSWSLPEKRADHQFLTCSETALKDLGLDPSELDNEEFRKIVSGEYYLENADTFLDNGFPFPYSQAYAGWQFGQFAGQLGDGRVVNLFEVPKAIKGAYNRNKYELQLKGSGKTPYSRFADGKAVLRSSIREYIISEHLNAIGIPSTRALSLSYLPKTLAQRSRVERCAIVARFAESWVRLGTFDLYRWRGDRKGIRKLSNYVINELYTIEGEKFGNLNEILKLKPDILDNYKEKIGDLTDYDKMYFEAIIRNASTTAMWQSYGFLNGVLNTDNTSILGLSMDFGPFSIMDRYDPNYTPNSEDHEHRYGYRNTPTSIWWNLTRLGENLAELIGAGKDLLNDPFFNNEGVKKEWEEAIIKRATSIIEVGGEIYQYTFLVKYIETLFKRLGLSSELINYENPNINNEELIVPMFEMLFKVQCDFNKFFLILQEADIKKTNFEKIAEMILLPIKEEKISDTAQKHLKGEITKWLKIYCTYLNKQSISRNDRKNLASKYNPLFLPRNWILDQVIEFSEKNDGVDLSYLKKLEKMSLNPFERSKWGHELKELEDNWLIQGDIGEDLSMLQCSCSS